MRHDPTEGDRLSRQRIPSRWERLASAKLSVPIMLAFFAFLATMSAAATGVSYLVHHLAHR